MSNLYREVHGIHGVPPIILFHEYVERLLQHFGERVGLTEADFRDQFLSLQPSVHALDQATFWSSKGSVPFVLIPQWPRLAEKITLKERAARIKLFGNQGQCYLDETKILPTHAFTGHYIIRNVDDGNWSLGMHAHAALAQICHEGRNGLDTVETLTLLTYFPEILGEHSIDIAGYGNSIPLKVPRVNIRYDSDPTKQDFGTHGIFGYFDDDVVTDARCGSPSCGERIGPCPL